MTNRDWLCLALRLFGIWTLIRIVGELSLYFQYFIAGALGAGSLQGLASIVISLIVRTALALILILFAPAIAARFRSTTPPDKTDPPEFDETRTLKVGIQLLAVYALLLSVQAAGPLIYGLLTPPMDKYHLQSLLTFGLNLAFAGILLMWNDRIITLIEKFRYVPERDAYQPPPLEE